MTRVPHVKGHGVDSFIHSTACLSFPTCCLAIRQVDTKYVNGVPWLLRSFMVYMTSAAKIRTQHAVWSKPQYNRVQHPTKWLVTLSGQAGFCQQTVQCYSIDRNILLLYFHGMLQIMRFDVIIGSTRPSMDLAALNSALGAQAPADLSTETPTRTRRASTKHVFVTLNCLFATVPPQQYGILALLPAHGSVHCKRCVEVLRMSGDAGQSVQL